jgi:signal transduction histidine kinase
LDREDWVGRARRAISAGLAHDLRTPLAHIRMFTEMLLMGRDRSVEERMQWLESIDRETHRLGEVLENLLLFVHGEEPDAFPARRRTDLGALAEDVAVSFAARAALVGTLVALLYLLGGGRSPVGWIVLIAAGLFTVAFAVWLAQNGTRSVRSAR